MGARGLLGRPRARGGGVGAEHARAAAPPGDASQTLQADVEDLDGLAEMADGGRRRCRPRSTSRSPRSRSASRALEEQRLFSGRLRRRRRARDRQRRRGRHRRAGLGRDGAAHGDALGRAARLQGRAAGGQRRARKPGIKSATFRVSGENAYGLFGAERGVHRLVRLSPFDSAHRRQTSFAGVEVAPVVEDTGEVEINDDDLQVDTYRASGAGGQHVNKTDSAVRITHRPTGIVVQCQNERSQSSNRATAMAMLRAKLLERKERERQEEIAREKGEAQDVNFGSQIRSYVLHPYTMVKDHRTGLRDGRRAARARRRPRRVRARVPAARQPRSAGGGLVVDELAGARAARARGGRRRRRRDDRGDRRRRGARARARSRRRRPGVIYGLDVGRGRVRAARPGRARSSGSAPEGEWREPGRPVLRGRGRRARRC